MPIITLHYLFTLPFRNKMSEGIAPFVSSSPPPLDDDNFKFGDEDDLFGGGSVGHASNEIYVQEFETVKSQLPIFEIELEKTSDLSNAIEGCVEEFDEFLDYQSITVNDTNVNMVTAPMDSMEPQICDTPNFTNLNQTEVEAFEDTQFKCDEFENFEEFVSNERVETVNEIDIQSKVNEVVSLDDMESLKVDYESREIESEVPDSASDSREKVFIEAHICQQNSSVVNQQQGNILKEESWACFESFAGDSFADEQLFPSDTSKHPSNDVDDFGDFGGFEEATERISNVIHISYGTEIFKEVFSAQPSIGSGSVNPLISLIGAQDSRPGTYGEHAKYSRIWKNLESIETTPALSLHWKNSSLFQNYLKTINISQQSLVSSRPSNVPFFASNLGFLEPTKLYGDGVSDSKDYGNTFVNDIPKVEFDWASSVLMDPLDVGNVCHLDLDFFGDAVFASCLSPACKKEKELLESLEPSLSDPQKLLSLDSFMASVASNNVTLIKNHAGLSVTPHLKIILDRLPDLSFMQAKVLMFPMREEFIGTTETFS